MSRILPNLTQLQAKIYPGKNIILLWLVKTTLASNTEIALCSLANELTTVGAWIYFAEFISISTINTTVYRIFSTECFTLQSDSERTVLSKVVEGLQLTQSGFFFWLLLVRWGIWVSPAVWHNSRKMHDSQDNGQGGFDVGWKGFVGTFKRSSHRLFSAPS